MVDIYRFRVRGHLDDCWSDWLGGLAIQRQEDGTTVLVGPVVDQAALHGVIIRIRDLGLSLLSVQWISGSLAEKGKQPLTPTLTEQYALDARHKGPSR